MRFIHTLFLSGLFCASGAIVGIRGLDPVVVYNGGYSDATEIKLRISNARAGQSGLLGAWADAFIQYSVKTKGYKPFQVYLLTTYELLWILMNPL